MIAYDGQCRFIWFYIGRKICHDLAYQRRMSAKELRDEVQKNFKEVLKRTPDIGKSSFRFNLIWGCLLFSLPQVLLDLTEEEFRCATKQMFRYKIFLKTLRKKIEPFPPEGKASPEMKNSHYEFDWETSIDQQQYPIEKTINFTRCGLHALAKQEKMEKWLPLVCELDYFMYEGTNAALIRTKTLARGDEVCNFRFVNKKYRTASEIMAEEGLSKDDLV